MSHVYSEERFRAMLDEPASKVFDGLLGVGYDLPRAAAELKRLDLWQDPAERERYLQRSPTWYQAKLGGNRMDAAYRCRDDLRLAGRTLASWQCLRPKELDWLRAIAAQEVVWPELSVLDAQEILRIHERSAAELAEWLKARPKVLVDEESACTAGHWWRREPVSHYPANWRG